MSQPHQFALSLVGGTGCGSAAFRNRRRLRGAERCESEPERRLAYAFSRLEQFEPRGITDQPWIVGRWPDLVLLAQPLWGQYRADFAIVTADWRCPAPLPVVIEVDGFEWHDRTREQADRDRQRDRFMVLHGASVLRFTAREVFCRPEDCAAEVLSCAHASLLGRRHD